MKQKLILLALVFGLTIVSQSTLSLGMGNIQVYSSLDEPLRATIELMTNPEEDLQNLTVKLASSNDYKKVGLDKSFVPSNIMVNLDEDNPYLIKVTSNGPVSEPIISLLLDVDWNNGRILREFTVLLDPPVYDVPSSNVQVNNVVVEPIQEQVVEESEPALQEREVSEPEQQQVYTNEDVAQYEDSAADDTAETQSVYDRGSENSLVTVNAGDTLWRIANENKLGGLSANQMMIAIYNNNPSAFIDNNINKLIKGSQLQMPTLAQAEAISYYEALQQVQSHNNSWSPAESDYSSYQTSDDNYDDYSDNSTSLDYGVELTGGDSDGSDNGQSNAEVGNNDSSQLSAEEQYNQEAENQELQERISELEDIVEQQQAVLEVEDTGLANLEDQLEAAGDDTNQLAEDTTGMADDVWDTEVDDTGANTDSLDLDIAAVDTESDGIADDMVDPVDEEMTEPMTDDAVDTSDSDAAMVDEVAEPAKEEKTIPKFSGNTQQEESFVDKSINWVMDNLKWVLIGLGGLVLLLLVPKFLRRDSEIDEETSFLDDIKQRKSSESEGDAEDDFAETADTKMNQPLEEDDEDPFSTDDSEVDSDDVLAELDKSISFDDLDDSDVEEDDPFASTDEVSADADDDGFDLDGFLNDEESLSSDDSVTADHTETLSGMDFDDESDPEFEDLSFDDLGADLDESLLDKDVEEADLDTVVDETLEDLSEASEELEDSLELDDELDEFDLDGFDLDDESSESLSHSDDSKDSDDSENNADDALDLDDLDEDLDFDLSEELDDIETSDDDSDESSDEDDDFSLDDSSDDEFDGILDLSDDEETFDTDGDDSMDEEIDLGLEGLLDDGDAIDTKLDLAKAYLDMGDVDGARNLLEEVASEGNASQVEEAKKILGDM